MEKIKVISNTVWGERHKILRFLISGGSATFVDFFFLYAFTEWAGFYYLVSSVLAFLISITVSFILQKFWTFKNNSREDMRQQVLTYISIAVLNLVINTSLVFIFVEYAGFHYLLGQFLSSVFIALESFFVYHFLIFKLKKQENVS